MDKFEKSVMAQLKGRGLHDAQITEIAKTAALINASDLRGLRIFTKGIPIPDWIRISGIADRAAVKDLLENVLTGRLGEIGGISVFPYGIPNIETFKVDVTLGHQG